MKKTITILFATLTAFCVFAKTPDELIAEFNAKASSDKDYKVAQQIAIENASDVKSAVQVWANGDVAKFDEATCKARTTEQSKNVQAARMIAGQYLNLNSAEIKSVPLAFACLVISRKVIGVYSVDNPNFYEELKASGFKVDGVEIPPYARLNLVLTAKDYDYLATLPVGQCYYNLDYIPTMVERWLNMSDVSQALNQAKKLRNFYIVRKWEIPTQLKSVIAELTKDLVSAKLK